MIRVIAGKYRLHQFAEWVELSVYCEPFGWVANELHRTWYGYLLGFTEPFPDEESANYAFAETAKYLDGLSNEGV